MQLSKTKYLAFIADKFYSVACTSNSLYPCFAILKVDNLRLRFTKNVTCGFMLQKMEENIKNKAIN